MSSEIEKILDSNKITICECMNIMDLKLSTMQFHHNTICKILRKYYVKQYDYI